MSTSLGMQPAQPLELLSDQEIKREDLAVVGVSGQHQVDSRRDRRLPAQWTMVEKNLESFRIQFYFGKFPPDLIFILSLIHI